jgi:hypothetical protein
MRGTARRHEAKRVVQRWTPHALVRELDGWADMNFRQRQARQRLSICYAVAATNAAEQSGNAEEFRGWSRATIRSSIDGVAAPCCARGP